VQEGSTREKCSALQVAEPHPHRYRARHFPYLIDRFSSIKQRRLPRSLPRLFDRIRSDQTVSRPVDKLVLDQRHACNYSVVVHTRCSGYFPIDHNILWLELEMDNIPWLWLAAACAGIRERKQR